MAEKSVVLILNKSGNDGFYVEAFEYAKPSPPVDEDNLRRKQVVGDRNVSRTAVDLPTLKSVLSGYLDSF